MTGDRVGRLADGIDCDLVSLDNRLHELRDEVWLRDRERVDTAMRLLAEARAAIAPLVPPPKAVPRG